MGRRLSLVTSNGDDIAETTLSLNYVQLGQPSMNPPRLVLEVGGTSTLQAAVPVKLKSPPLQASKWGGTSALQAWLPAKLKSPPLQAEVWGGSR